MRGIWPFGDDCASISKADCGYRELYRERQEATAVKTERRNKKEKKSKANRAAKQVAM